MPLQAIASCPRYNKSMAFTQLRFAGPALDALHRDLISLEVVDNQTQLTPLPFTCQSANPSQPGIDLSIPAHSTVGFVGATGGKATVDIILGLLEPEEGHLSVDGQPITPDKCRRWQPLAMCRSKFT